MFGNSLSHHQHPCVQFSLFICYPPCRNPQGNRPDVSEGRKHAGGEILSHPGNSVRILSTKYCDMAYRLLPLNSCLCGQFPSPRQIHPAGKASRSGKPITSPDLCNELLLHTVEVMRLAKRPKTSVGRHCPSLCILFLDSPCMS